MWDFLGENVVVQRNSPSLVFSTWSFIELQIRVYRKIENNTHILKQGRMIRNLYHN